MIDYAVCILAGGQASRLDRKLERPLRGTPLIARVYGNVCGPYPIYISARATFPAEIDAQLNCPLIIDRWNARGPLSGLLTVFQEVVHTRMFVIAGDAPFVDRSTLEALRAAWQDGDEAVVADPLVALYDRAAFIREALPVFHDGSASVKDVLRKLSARPLPVPKRTLTNINTLSDLKSFEKYEVTS
ncbi:MAG: molybdenum cofactor guanylyltransferase [Candidatus Eremiobacteraeota bacterium]|nr:molybdenum cofactor guanylyltransferase [Candidatus Eremiobacteraeota bacterium]